ncbi:hypothetical protein [Streptomyces sp. NBC_00996]|uniref:hypothetical protein n=1 Tax=Streptomyces sp. NBC_00996 TaxID=2903710 RepID=UPI00386AC628|nr:hypothetical protein OG390_30325 [Streptomyces sp. NBC_00996]
MGILGRKKDEPTIDPVPWDGSGGPDWFTVGDVLRSATFRRKALTGERAVRVPTMRDGVRYFAPAALVSSADRADSEPPSYELHEAEQSGNLLCALTPVKGGARYRVTDAQGEELGLVHRTPAAKRTIQHSWWLQQPGHSDIVARYHWARGSAKEIAARGKERAKREAGELAGSVVDSILSFGAEDDERASLRTPNHVTWRAEGEEERVVLTLGHLDGVTVYQPHASWLDRRLAFALAVLREA